MDAVGWGGRYAKSTAVGSPGVCDVCDVCGVWGV